MTRNKKNLVLAALDKLGLALAAAGHKWTRAERRTYEAAARLLTN